MSRQHRPFLHIFQFVSTNATGVKSSSAALNLVTLPLHKHGLVVIDPLCQAHLRVRSARGEYNTWPFSVFVNSFAQPTQYIYSFPRCSSGPCKFSIVILGCYNTLVLLSSCFLSFLIHLRVDRSIRSLCQQVLVLVQALSTLNLILGLAIG